MKNKKKEEQSGGLQREERSNEEIASYEDKELQTESGADSQENDESENKEDHEVFPVTSVESRSEEKTEREIRNDILFSSYPLTCEELKQDTDFEVTEGIERLMAMIEGYSCGSGCESVQLDRSLSMLFRIGRGYKSGHLNIEMVEILMKGMDYDRKLAEEVQAAEVRGRNANIEARMRTRGKSDGVPRLESRGADNSKRNRGIFSLAEDARI